MRRRLFLWVTLGLFGAALFVPTSAAEHDSVDSDPLVVDSESDIRMTEGTIDRVSNTLLVLAASIGLMLVLYIAHTSPQRRVRVARRRRDVPEARLSP